MNDMKLSTVASALKDVLIVATGASLLLPQISIAATERSHASEDNRVVITGSRIKRTDSEGVSPVSVITRQDLTDSGATNLSDYLRTLTISNNFSDDNNNSFANGTSTINLRGLGNNATLVLVNGRRMSSYGQAQNVTEAFVDINSIPLAAVDRIEILKDGASALYGADAVAGVVNFILRQDYEGAEVSVGFQDTSEGGGAQTTASLLVGGGNNNTHFTISMNYLKRDALFYSERDFSESADQSRNGLPGYDQRSSRSPYGTIISFAENGEDLVGNPHPDCPENSVKGGLCRFNYNEFINFFPESERFGTSTYITHNFTNNMEGYIDLSINRNRSLNIAAPAPWFGPFGLAGQSSNDVIANEEDLELALGGSALYLPSTNPYNIFGENVGVFSRPLVVGPREGEITGTAYRFASGVKGEMGLDWNYDIGFLYTRSDVLVENRGNTNAIRVQQALLGIIDPAGSGDMLYLNPFATGGENDQRVKDFVGVTYENRNSSYEKGITANFSGSLLDMDAGELGLAVGVEIREQTYIAEADALRNQGLLVGTGAANDTRGSRDTTSLYAELAIPVTESLEVQLAARYEDYSDFGTTTKPKIGVKWSATEDLMFRASYGESFRAPSLVELFAGKITSFVGGVNDPIRCPDSIGGQPGVNGNADPLVPRDCGNGQFQVDNGGNSDLGPEESESLNFGVVWSPAFLEGFTAVVDVFQFEHENIIGQLPLSAIMSINDPSFVHRIGGDPNAPILSIDRSFINGDSQEQRGIDTEFRYTFEALNGAWVVRNNATFYDKYNFTVNSVEADGTSTQTVLDGLGNQDLGAFPRFKNNLTVNYAQGDHSFASTIHHRSKVEAASPNSITGEVYNTEAWTTLDISYSMNTSLGTIQLGCVNCTNEDPEFDPTANEEAGYLKSVDDPRGLVGYVRWTTEF